jgi:hypothetical protein
MPDGRALLMISDQRLAIAIDQQLNSEVIWKRLYSVFQPQVCTDERGWVMISADQWPDVILEEEGLRNGGTKVRSGEPDGNNISSYTRI